MKPKDLMAFRLELVDQLLPAAPSSERPHGISGSDADLMGVSRKFWSGGNSGPEDQNFQKNSRENWSGRPSPSASC